MWCLQVANFLTGQRLNQFGILPRDVGHLIGIAAAPFIHGGFWHLSMNTLPFLVLGCLVCVQGIGRFYSASVAIIVICGLMVWIFGRDGYHIGASGWIFGLWGYLLTYGFLKRDFRSLVIGLLVIVAYGGMIYGLLTFEPHTSAEGHLFGALAGVFWASLDAKKKRRSTALKRR